MNVFVPAVGVFVASAVAPSLKTTLPVGVPPGPVTVAVNVTDWPNTDGFCDEATTVVEPALLTVWAKLVEVLALKLRSREWVALRGGLVTDSEKVANMARPELNVLVACSLPPRRRVTGPV